MNKTLNKKSILVLSTFHEVYVEIIDIYYKNKGKKTDLSSLGQSSQVMAIENTLLKAL